MAEELLIHKGTRRAQYESLFPQIEALLAGEADTIACMANVTAALNAQFGHFWIGFYLVKGDELVLGPFQGPIACTRIKKGRGVCGTVWEKKETMIVPDVDAFPGHIVCNGSSKSEIVLPLISNGEVWAVLDLDSDRLDEFTTEDAYFLAKIVNLIPILD